MTAEVTYQAMTAITANTATGNTAQSAALVAKSVIPQSAQGVLMSVPAVMCRSAVIVQLNAKSVKKHSVRIV